MNDTKFETAASVLCCPVCGGVIEKENASLLCGAGHRFDIAKKGYVNLAPHKKSRLYDAALFESRQRAFRAGFYDEVCSALIKAAKRHVKNAEPVLLDAGCGEGFYALGLKKALPGAGVIGIDLEKEAVQIAARGGNDVIWLVADLAHIPLKAHGADAVFNIFSPAGYAEFKRVLKPGGVLVKAVPGEFYLKELRQAAQGELSGGAYSPARVLEHFGTNWQTLERIRVTNTYPVTPEQLADFLRLTPMLARVDMQKLQTAHIKTVTIDVEIAVGKEYIS